LTASFDPYGESRLPRRKWLKRVAGTFVGGATAVGLYTRFIEPNWVEVVRKPMTIANLPESLDGCTLVQISDIHIGHEVDDDFLIEWFKKVATWNPDIVVFTGDFLTLRRDRSVPTDQLEEVLSHFPRGTLATIGILGNHDYGVNWSDSRVADGVTLLAEDSGLEMIRNETRNVDGLQIVGFDDYWGTNFGGANVLKNVDLAQPTLVLCHNPDVVDLPIWSGYRGWILSGHTHGGQCKAPFFKPPLLPIHHKRYFSGEIPLADGRRLYVNRALGHSMPVRFNVRPEVTIFQLTRERST
jgi:predicted MPP superfamily phosphohydrolase